MTDTDNAKGTLGRMMDGFEGYSVTHKLELYHDWLETRDFVILMRPETPKDMLNNVLATLETRRE